MPKSKKPRKPHNKRRIPTLSAPQNLHYWYPIMNQIASEYPHESLRAVSDDVPSDAICDAILKPYDHSIAQFDAGQATFTDYWVLLQGFYLLSFLLDDTLTVQRYRIYERDAEYGDKINELAVEHLLAPYRKILLTLADDYPQMVQNIGKRQRRIGKFGMTGDERQRVYNIRNWLEDLLSWCSVAMLHRAVQQSIANLSNLEHQKFRIK